MNPVTLFLLTIAGIFLVGTIGESIFRKTNIPDVVWLILMGLFLGPVAHLLNPVSLGRVAPYFAALTLVVILFEGGSRLNIKQVAQESPRSGLLALLTFLVSVAVIFLASFASVALGFFPAWTWKHCLLLGIILGGSSSIVVMPTLQQSKVDPKLSGLLNLESSFTDVLCVVGASSLMDLMGEGRAVSPLVAFGKSLGIGLFVGAAAGTAWLLILKRLRASENAYPVTLSALLILYVAIEHMGGSAALGILVFAILVGNASWIAVKFGVPGNLDMGRSVRDIHTQIAFIIKSFFFTFIGAMLSPPWPLLGFGVFLGLLLLPARIPGAWAAGWGGAFTPRQRRLAVACLPRGMAAGVLATLPATAGIPGTASFPVIVFSCVFTTILVFTLGFSLASGPAEREPDKDPSAPA
jgi:Na+:H+ antiporter